jgi:hypothetical protein
MSVIFSVYKSMLIKKEAANEKEWGYPVDGLIADIIGGHPRPSY